MKGFPSGISFCYEWRSYQARVLKELEEHLQNKHLHLVAPPGSGKTVLGLEVMLRLNKPTFILAPTIAIRNQWADRFQELFLQTESRPEWISTNIRNPALITITTYQSLHSIYQESNHNTEDEQKYGEVVVKRTDREKVIDLINDINFQTIILDEAHHLRTAWWQSTINFRDQLNDRTVVSLTATPPYDVSLQEWQRYIELCGPIDAEIYVPELVREAELCPHQDYIYMSMPSDEEAGPINEFIQNVTLFQNEIINNKSFINLMESHPWIVSPEEHVEDMLSNQPYFSSILIFLKETGSRSQRNAIKTLQFKEKNLPKLSLKWLEELLTGILFNDDFIERKTPLLNNFHKRLSQIGAIERRKVQLRSIEAINRSLVNSSSKLSSIEEIVSFENKALGNDLRLVILADFIYRDDLPLKKGEEKPIVRLGVIPIFEKLRREVSSSVKIGVLTGSIVIVPRVSLSLLQASADDMQVTFSYEVMRHDPNYVSIYLSTSIRQKMVAVMTNLFTQGGITVLIGTTALLGEGWDAPSINSLIIASYVGTYMLSNQMRGRAIRTEKGNPNKTANIWHLVCVEPYFPDGGHDFQALTRRFTSLFGLSVHEDTIRTGIGRMNLIYPPYEQADIKRQNEEMFHRARNRHNLFFRWRQAVAKLGNKVEQLLVDDDMIPRPFMFYNTIRWLITTGFMMFIFTLLYYSGSSFPHWREVGFIFPVVISLVFALLVSIPIFLKALKITLRNLSVESSMDQVAEAVYHTLHNMRLIQTKLSDNEINLKKDNKGMITCSLKKGTTHEQKLFLRSLQEVVDPIENPRYLLYRRSSKRFYARKDYHAVPEAIGRRKEYAEYFLQQWEHRIGEAELIYTRTIEGRKMLLTARVRAMSAEFIEESEQISEWE